MSISNHHNYYTVFNGFVPYPRIVLHYGTALSLFVNISLIVPRPQIETHHNFIYTTLTPQIKGYISHIALTTERYQVLP